MTRVRVATRGSELALVQARYVGERIRRELGFETELVIVKTTGDRLHDVPLAEIGGKGLFLKEIEEALLEERADVAVHSAKDLPVQLADGLALVAFPQRVDARDALVARERGASVADLPQGARIGTGSTRRTAQLLAARPDLEIVPLRGNVPTRIAKLEREALDAVVLACAGLDRLGLQDAISERIPPDLVLPAVCQGTLAVQVRADDERTAVLADLDDPDVAVPTAAERAFLARLEGDCTTPLAVFAERQPGGGLRVRGLVASARGEQLLRAEATGPAERAGTLGREVAESLLAQGGEALLRANVPPDRS
jgi:hydroxymethylbilane synthase